MTDVDVRGVRAGYAGVDVLTGVDLTVPAGSLAAILGESGSGKTTLLRVLAGFVRPSGGTVHFGAREIVGPGIFVPPEKRHVGIVPQEGALFPHLDVRRNVAFGLPRGGEASQRVEEVLELVGMRDLADARPQELSGGQQQRVAVARALAPRPEVVLMDEPFTALDARLRVRLRSEVRELLRETATTAILVTHDQEEALSIADLVSVMRDGRLVQTGSPQEVYGSPVDLSVAQFVGDVVSMPVLASIDSRRVRCSLGEIDVEETVASRKDSSQVGSYDVVVVRPEQLTIVDREDQANGSVAHVRYHGHDALVRVRMDDGADVDVRIAGRRPPLVGARVEVSVNGGGRRYRTA